MNNEPSVLEVPLGANRPKGRTLGIRHRIKQTKDQDARPTMVAVQDLSGALTTIELPDEQAELDYLCGRYPIIWRECGLDEDVSGLPEHHVQLRSVKEGDELVERHPSQCHFVEKGGRAGVPKTRELVEVAHKVPSVYTGIEKGDTVAMILGGSGDNLAFALSRKLESLGGEMLRIPPFKLKEFREVRKLEKDQDHATLVAMVEAQRADFYDTRIRDRGVIRVCSLYRTWMDCMKARIAGEQRFLQHGIGEIFCRETGGYPEGGIKKELDHRRITDPILQALVKEEERAEKELERHMQKLDIWTELFEGIPGIGPKIGARIVAAVIDVRRFPTPDKLAKFMGVHVLPDGRFPRHRTKEVCGWQPDARQALYLLADQFNRQGQKTKWGKYLIDMKAAILSRHPEPIKDPVTGKKKYTKGHIHKMAIWRTLTRFVRALHRDWMKLEREVINRSNSSQPNREAA